MKLRRTKTVPFFGPPSTLNVSKAYKNAANTIGGDKTAGT